MAKAVLRYCPKCKHGPFEKDAGCNRVRCPKCKHRHCYACGEAVPQYSVHYGTGKPCPLFEDTKERLKIEAAVAQERVVRQVMEKQPELKAEDVIVDQSLLVRGLNYAWNGLPHSGRLQHKDDRISNTNNPVRITPPEDWTNPVCLAIFHTIHGTVLVCVLGLTVGLLKDSQHLSRAVKALLGFAIFTVFSSILSKFCRDIGGVSTIFLSLPASIAMSVYLANSKFGSIPHSTRLID